MLVEDILNILVNVTDDTIIDSTTNYLNHYSEQTSNIISNAGTAFTYQKKETVVNCFDLHNNISKKVE